MTGNATNENEGSNLIGYLLGAVLAVQIVVTVTGNLIVLWSFKRDRELRIPRYFYIFNLCLCDLLRGLFVMPIALTDYVSGESLPKSVCMYGIYLSYTLFSESVLSIILISADRYLMVKDSFSYIRNETNGRTGAKIATSWLVAMTWNGVTVLLWNYIEQSPNTVETRYCTPIYELSKYIYIFSCAEFGLPLMIITALNLATYCIIAGSQKVQVHTQSQREALQSATGTDVGSCRELLPPIRSKHPFGPIRTQLFGTMKKRRRGKLSRGAAPRAAVIEVTTESPTISRKVSAKLFGSAASLASVGEQPVIGDMSVVSAYREQMSDRSHRVDLLTPPPVDYSGITPIDASSLNSHSRSPGSTRSLKSPNQNPDRSPVDPSPTTISLKSPNQNQSMEKERSMMVSLTENGINKLLQAGKRGSRASVDILHEKTSGVSDPNHSIDNIRKTGKTYSVSLRKVGNSLAILVGIYFLCWLPTVTCIVVNRACSGCVPSILSAVSALIAYLDPALNPLIYGLSHKRFAKNFRGIVCFWKH